MRYERRGIAKPIENQLIFTSQYQLTTKAKSLDTKLEVLRKFFNTYSSK